MKRTVLVVDDELINRELLGAILQQKYDVIYAENGRKAIDIVRKIPGRISLVLLDLLMPEVIMARVQRSIELAEDSDIILATETDRLTGLYNKDFFFQYCTKSDVYVPGRQMDAIAVNVSRFHLVNELTIPSSV